MGVNRGVGLLVCLLLTASLSVAQSTDGTISGIVLDPSGGVIVGAYVLIINNATGVEYPGRANSEGYYVVPNIPPGNYRIQVSNSGFKTIIKPDIVVHVEDALAINFTLPIGAASEIVTVQGGAPLINTTDASVSTVVDRKYVENMPLNGRSFQDLILLTPGIVAGGPNSPASLGGSGEFSVNGQRTESNYYTVDGVSANTGIYPGAINGVTAGISGSVSNATALGTTQSLVSVDALEEFRVQSSTYSAEYGRNPGGQFSLVTRSGSNDWHGSAFEYLRNNYFDANNWFNDYYGVPESALRQNDFGGTLGGPIEIPHVYNGKDRTFFFFSYEGLRLLQPQPATVNYVPDATLRASTPSELQQVINAFPVPNGPEVGNGLAKFLGTWSNPSSIDALSIRLDEKLTDKLRLFFRFSNTPSNSVSRSTVVASQVNALSLTTDTYTLGITSAFSNRLSNEFRLNYSSVGATNSSQLDDFGGANPVNLAQLQGIDTAAHPAYSLYFGLFFGDGSNITQQVASSHQRQWNLVDAINLSKGRHQFKFGVDYRRLTPTIAQPNPSSYYYYFSENSVLTNDADSAFAASNAPAYPLYTNFSSFAQDEWRLSPRLSLSMGLRWDVNPAPGVTQGLKPYTVLGASDFATMTLAPQGTPLWKTTWYDFAPRLGAAYILRTSSSFETVVRGGAGIFYDTAQQNGSYGFLGPGFSGEYFGTGQNSFPVPGLGTPPVIVNPPVPPYTNNVSVYPDLALPYTIQTNLSIEQALGSSQALTVAYVGAFGRKLMEQVYANTQGINPNFSYVNLFQNGLSSDYNALQFQFQRRMSAGLQGLASYTLSHCIDYGSQNIAYAYQRGDCDFDVRHNFSAALSYEFPNSRKKGWTGVLIDHWAFDDRITLRSGYPVFPQADCPFNPNTGLTQCLGLDVVPAQPSYLYGANCAAVYQALGGLTPGQGCPGGRAINVNAFTLPPVGQYGDAPRNFLRGFGAWQMDLAVRREFPIHERLRLQFRAEAFNIFNHPNFGFINSYYYPGTNTFGLASGTLAQSLGGLSSLYQFGGPRSMQFALKLLF